MTPGDASRAHRVYCAGPLFNQAERNEMTAIADALEQAGYDVFLPHRDSMEFRLVHRALIDRGCEPAAAAESLHAAIFALDVYQLVLECNCVVWNLNGRTPDEGAVSEAAIAWSLGKPIVAFRDDVRTLVAGRMNPLLVGLVEFNTVDRLSEIPGALSDQLARHNPPRVSPADLPPKVQSAVKEGRTLWERLHQDAEPIDEAVCAALVAEFLANSKADS